MSLKLLLAGSAALLAVSAPAQRFQVLRQDPALLDDNPASAMALADIDGDGDLDLYVVHTRYQSTGDNQDRVYVNDGRGRFTQVTGRTPGVRVEDGHDVDAGDVDGDGDVDLLFSSWSGLHLLLNNGAGVFLEAPAQLPPVAGGKVFGVHLADCDGDRDLDVILSCYGGQDRLLRNDGRGRFTDDTATAMPVDTDRTTDLDLGDVDGDGDPDLVLSSSFGNNRLYLNNGAGVFRASSTLSYQATCYGVGLADLDGDGDLDACWATSAGPRITRNVGGGSFTLISGTGVEQSLAADVVHCADFNRDGRSDIVVGTRQGANALFLSDGRGGFTRGALPSHHAYSKGLEVGDVDGDGDLDLGVANLQAGSMLLYSDGMGALSHDPGDGAPLGPGRGMALGDVDGDLDLDVMIVGGNDALHLNDGNASFAVSWRPGRDSHCCALSDLDGDQDLDLVLGGNQAVEFYRNDGRGNFTLFAPATLTAPAGTVWVFPADLDGDGDADLLASFTGLLRVYENVGASFVDITRSSLPQAGQNYLAVVCSDVDRDGDLDLLCSIPAAWPNAMRLLVNDGKAGFRDVSSTQMPARARAAKRLVVADIDKDGDLDLIGSNVPDPTWPRSGHDGRNDVYTNDGRGTFRLLGHIRTQDATAAEMAVGDVDGDGDPDLVFTGVNRRQELQLNDGSGSFSRSPLLPSNRYWTSCLGLEDLDLDGDLDLLVIDLRNGSKNHVFRNLLRQVHAPRQPLLGKTYTLDFYAGDGTGAAATSLLVAMAPAALVPRLPLLPLGYLGIDMRAALGPVQLQTAAATGMVSVSVAIPQQPGLVGVGLHTQALFLHGGVIGDRLSNVQSDSVRR